MMGYRYGYNMIPWGGLFGFFLLVLIIIIAVAIYKIITSGRKTQYRTINDNSIDILKQRYARGEIDEEQYKKMRNNIESK